MSGGRRVIACIGAGRMGRGIAHCAAYAGDRVNLIDAKAREPAAFKIFAAETLREIEGALRALAGLGGFDAAAVPVILERIAVHSLEQAEQGLREAEIVFEGVPEIEAVKAEAFGLFDRHAPADAILASTTSTFLSTMLAAYTRRPENFLNAHWLNPAFLVPLVEVSPGDRTDDAATVRLTAYLEDIGKVPVVCKASPGYIVPRIQALAMNEAARLVEEGVASAEDVDKAVKYGFGLRFAVLGLLEFIDWGGGDILYYASRYMSEAMESERFAAPEIIERNMAESRIGLKTGEGFYDYRNRDVDAYRQQRMSDFLKLLKLAGTHRDPVV